MNYLGNYRGVVLSSDDPKRAGRVKVWVPDIHEKVYESYGDVDESSIIEGLRSNTIEDIANRLPWSSTAQPLVGGGGGRNYDYGGINPTFGDGVPALSGSSLQADVGGRVNREELRAFLIREIRNSQLNGVVPEDASNFKIDRDGSAESWANFFTALAYNESNYNTGTVGDVGRFRGNSNGLFQLSPDDAINHRLQSEPYTLEQLVDPATNVRATIGIATNLLRQDSVINGGSSRGLSRYWGPVRRNEVNVPPVPPTTIIPPSEPSTTIDPTTQEQTVLAPQTTSEASTPTQKPAQSYSTASGNYTVSSETRDIRGKSAVRAKGRPISLDFNSSGGNSGILIIVPDNVTQEERRLCQEYLQACSNFFRRNSRDPKSGIINSRPIRTTSENRTPSNQGGVAGFFHTEPFDQDAGAMDAIRNNPQEFANILANTLGRIPNAFFFPPHTSSGGGASFNGVNERDFARQWIIPYLDGSNGIPTGDAFTSVGVTHPEETRDRSTLSSIGASNEDIESIVENGRSIFEIIEQNKVDFQESNITQLTNLREVRTELWEGLELSEENDIIRNRYLGGNNLDYSSPPMNDRVNPAGMNYSHSSYNNAPRGSFTIPEVGANVWVFFEGGVIDYPVILANCPNAQDYAAIYDISSPSPDYPEPKEGDEAPINRGKSAVTSRGGSMEIVDTTGRERIRLVSYHGGAYSMDQMGTTELAIGAKSQLVKGNKFTTVRGSSDTHVDGDVGNIIIGDIVNKYGNVRGDVNLARQMKELHRPIHDKQRLFDLQRTEASDSLDSSPLQRISGENTPCPVCNGTAKFQVRTNSVTRFTSASDNGGLGVSERLEGGGSSISERSENTDVCATCNGTGVSPWSAEGNFDIDPLKMEIPDDINNISKAMSDLENRLGSGGNLTSYFSKSKTEFIGSDLNDLESIRVDLVGKRKMVGQAPSPAGNGVFPVFDATPHVEYVSTPSFGGDYTMMVSNKYELLVGANGINQKTLGSYNMQGRILTLAAEQVNISSNNEVLIDGGRNVTITGDTINIEPRSNNIGGRTFKSMNVDGTISSSSNHITKGGMHVEGEFSTQHITAPVEFQQTETTLSTGSLIGGQIIGIFDGRPVMSVSCSDCIVSAHSHTFPNAAMTLLDTNDDVRAAAAPCAEADPIMAQAVSHGSARGRNNTPIRYSNPLLFELFEDCDNDDWNSIVRDISEGNVSLDRVREVGGMDDIRDRLTSASDSPISQTQRESGCDPCS